LDAFLALLELLRPFETPPAWLGSDNGQIDLRTVAPLLGRVLKLSSVDLISGLGPNLPWLRDSLGEFVAGLGILLMLDLESMFNDPKQALAAAFKKLSGEVGPDWSAARARFENAKTIHPDGLFLLFEALCALNSPTADNFNLLEKWRKVEILFRQAALAPSVLYMAPRMASYYAAQAAAMVCKLGGGVDVEYKARALAGWRTSLALPDLTVAECLWPAIFAPQIGEHDTARAFCRRWIELAPDDTKPLGLLLDLELETRHYADAVAWADRILRASPENAAAREKRERAIALAGELAMELEEQR
jgi:hypothetical protein